ncbi:unnamed protein product [Effrenium voratum]|uniref:N-acetylglucosaminylphosphatidylinositol deacetylase n=1 Tax=Effrenium voratum TaxID=2562239 RepID=A0AA36JMK4_9DINO|nr:unnamed protein product [Effrenium voratum]
MIPALLVTAHAEDAVAFASDLLTSNVDGLQWDVVCATCGHPRERFAKVQFKSAIEVLKASGAHIATRQWPFPKCQHAGCELFAAEGASLAELLDALLREQNWHAVVTHNSQGEHEDVQHRAVHQHVRRAVAALPASREGIPRLYVFNPLPELNMTLSVRKTRAFQQFFADHRLDHARYMQALTLTGFTEHVVLADTFFRPKELSLANFWTLHQSTAVNFMYVPCIHRMGGWHHRGVVAEDSSESSCTAKGLHEKVHSMLEQALQESCALGGFALYRRLCRFIPHFLESRLSQQLQQMEASFFPRHFIQQAPGQMLASFRGCRIRASMQRRVSKEAAQGRHVLYLSALEASHAAIVHVFKNAGTAIAEATQRLGGRVYSTIVEPHHWNTQQHILDSKTWFRAALVRDPVERMLSAFHEVEKRRLWEANATAPEEFNIGASQQWLEQLHQTLESCLAEDEPLDYHYMPQANFLVDAFGRKYDLTYIGRVERLEEELKFIFRVPDLKTSYRSGPYADVSAFRIAQKDLPDSTLRLICQMYAVDYCCFGFDLPGACEALGSC